MQKTGIAHWPQAVPDVTSEWHCEQAWISLTISALLKRMDEVVKGFKEQVSVYTLSCCSTNTTHTTPMEVNRIYVLAQKQGTE